MDNHQEELARALKQKHYLEYCLPEVNTKVLFRSLELHFKDIIDGLNSLQSMKLVPFPPGDPRPINGELKKLFCL